MAKLTGPYRTHPTPKSPRVAEKMNALAPSLEHGLGVKIASEDNAYIVSRGTVAACRTGVAMLDHTERSIVSLERSAIEHAVDSTLHERQRARNFAGKEEAATELVRQVAASASSTRGNIHERLLAGAVTRHMQDLGQRLKGDQAPTTLAEWQSLLNAKLHELPGPGFLLQEDASGYWALICASFGRMLSHRNHLVGAIKTHERAQSSKREKGRDAFPLEDARSAALKMVREAIANAKKTTGSTRLTRFSKTVGSHLQNLQKRVKKASSENELRYCLANFVTEFPEHELLPRIGREEFCAKTVQTFGKLSRAHDKVRRKRYEMTYAYKVQDARKIHEAESIIPHFSPQELEEMSRQVDKAAVGHDIKPLEKQALIQLVLLC